MGKLDNCCGNGKQSVLCICLLLSVGLLAVVPRDAEGYIGACTKELNPDSCIVPACQAECFTSHKGWGHCAHSSLDGIFHCVCYYPCPHDP
ncbi:unnamed protein product [Linum tenue]|uniref:Uncharacterized protein n=1 Tax=Linum tenue TaxID=586396 RepID=A0AAV0JA01_9ROSI|nr:unnamed protein product [Linum tenue]